ARSGGAHVGEQPRRVARHQPHEAFELERSHQYPTNMIQNTARYGGRVLIESSVWVCAPSSAMPWLWPSPSPVVLLRPSVGRINDPAARRIYSLLPDVTESSLCTPM